ncbi:Protein MARD1 [Bienertia sinuspersici]
MLKKRSRSIQKDQQMGQITSDGGCEGYLQSDVVGQRQKTNSFFNVPGLFVGLTPKGVSDCDSVRSPTSPLDFKLFCNLGNSFRFPKTSHEGHQKCWVCHKVGLGSIVDSVDDRNLTEKDKVIIPSSNSKTILFGSQIRRSNCKGAPNSPICANFCEAPNSLPKNYAIFPHASLKPSSNLQKGSSDVLFEIGGDPLEFDPSEKIQLGIYRLGTRAVESRSKHSCFESEAIEKSSGFDLIIGDSNAGNKLTAGLMPIASGNEITRSLSPEEIELSEDYTCVISHGPNPKTTHIFGDCVLECHPTGIEVGSKRESLDETSTCLENCLQIPAAPSAYPSNGFLSYCHFCKKKLEEGKDIYMYRGEKAFCSWDCRLEEISIEEEQEKSIIEAPGEPRMSENGDEIFEKSIFVAI